MDPMGYCSIEQCQQHKGVSANRQTQILALGISTNFNHATIDTGGSDFVGLFPGNGMRNPPISPCQGILAIYVYIIYTINVVI